MHGFLVRKKLFITVVLVTFLGVVCYFVVAGGMPGFDYLNGGAITKEPLNISVASEVLDLAKTDQLQMATDSVSTKSMEKSVSLKSEIISINSGDMTMSGKE